MLGAALMSPDESVMLAASLSLLPALAELAVLQTPQPCERRQRAGRACRSSSAAPSPGALFRSGCGSVRAVQPSWGAPTRRAGPGPGELCQQQVAQQAPSGQGEGCFPPSAWVLALQPLPALRFGSGGCSPELRGAGAGLCPAPAGSTGQPSQNGPFPFSSIHGATRRAPPGQCLGRRYLPGLWALPELLGGTGALRPCEGGCAPPRGWGRGRAAAGAPCPHLPPSVPSGPGMAGVAS